MALPKKIDARIIKTLANIEKAFLSILEEKPYDDITIADILQKALVNRTTFYKYYTSKADLAHRLVDNLKNEFFIPMLDKRYSLSFDEFNRYIPEVFAQNHTKLKALWQISTPKTNLKQDCYHLIKQKYLAHMASCPNIHPDEDVEFQAHVLASLSLAIMDDLIQKDAIPCQSKHKDLQRVMNTLLHKQL